MTNLERCGFADLVKRQDGKFECVKCGLVMNENMLEMLKASDPVHYAELMQR